MPASIRSNPRPDPRRMAQIRRKIAAVYRRRASRHIFAVLFAACSVLLMLFTLLILMFYKDV